MIGWKSVDPFQRPKNILKPIDTDRKVSKMTGGSFY